MLVVEDEESYREALQVGLGNEGYEIELAEDGPDGLRSFAEHAPDIVLLDLLLPGMPGTEVCRRMRALAPVPVIMVTALGSEVDVVLGLELGASDYVTKPFRLRELVARMQAVLRRSPIEPAGALPAEIPRCPAPGARRIEAGPVRVDLGQRFVSVNGRAVYLSRLEFDLLAVLLSPPGQVRTREELIDQLWAGRELTDTRTLDTHVRRLRVKLEEEPARPSTCSRFAGSGSASTPREPSRLNRISSGRHGGYVAFTLAVRAHGWPLSGWWAAAGKGLRCAPPQASPFGGERPPSRARSPPTPGSGQRRGLPSAMRRNPTSFSSSRTRSASAAGSRRVSTSRGGSRLIAEGLEFTRYYTHSSPCSPSRASLFTGRYLPGHGVVDNVIQPEHTELDPQIPTIGSILNGAGYRSSYIGKWHLSQSASPGHGCIRLLPTGRETTVTSWVGPAPAWRSTRSSPRTPRTGSVRTRDAVRQNRPWFLTVALVNPHDVMWFPIDQPGYAQAHPEEVEPGPQTSEPWRRGSRTTRFPSITDDYEEIFEQLPANFDDDLHTKPEAHRQWRYDQQHGIWGMIDPGDKGAWLTAPRLLRRASSLKPTAASASCSKALEDAGAWDETVVIFTSDHGDMCGSHGLRSKGPFVYEEIMRVPLYIRVPGVTTAGTKTEALATHVDLAATICGACRSGPGRRRAAVARVPGSRSSAGSRATDSERPGPRAVRAGLGTDANG